MARRKSRADGIVGGGMITAWGILLSWLFCPPICVCLIVLLLIGGGVSLYAYFKNK